jgi:hypothetical protein
MYGWIKSGRDKISARGPYVHHPDERLKKRQTDRIRQYKKRKTNE